MKFAWIDEEKAYYPVSMLCRVLGVSRAGLYAWRVRPPSLHAQQDEKLRVLVRAAYEIGRRNYGARACCASCGRRASSPRRNE